jgi:uncharacterized protein
VDPESRFAPLAQLTGRPLRVVSTILTVIIALVFASSLSGQWMDLLSWMNADSFGMRDPIFGIDLGFYIFRLPFIAALRGWMLGLLMVTLVLTLLVTLAGEALALASGRFTISPEALRHLGIIGALIFVTMAGGYWLDRFDVLLASRSSSFFGAGYSDVHAQIPAQWILLVVCLVVAAAFLVAARRRSLKLLAQSFGAYVLAAVLAGAIYPALVQQFVVNPNEQSKELPFIRNNIRFTRLAYGLESIDERSLDPKETLTYDDVRADSATVRNIMLWDYRPLASTLDQLQVIRLYYTFPDVDIDRYRLPDASYRQVMFGVRELDQDKLPTNARTWVNSHLVYTHGYGLGMSPVNVVTDEGLPEFFVRDIPPVSPVGIDITRPEVYFGERTDNYVVVNGNIDEFDYPLGDANRMSRYTGNGGVRMGSLLRRLALASHFGDLNLLISGYVTPDSRILYNRNIHDRVRRVAPFLHFDGDPYIAATGGRLFWICDAYTVTDRYPYSRPAGDAGFNYIRNSVKVTIDAYSGEMCFYSIAPEKDPLIRVYGRMFPGLLRPIAEMPEGIRAHIRYPQDLFDVQSHVLATYHMEDPQVFYNKEDVWNIATEKLQDEVVQMESYYAIMRLPGEEREEFILMVPYTPNKRDNMIAWLCARSDGKQYGRLLVYKFPKRALTYGPMQVSGRIDQDPLISQQLTLWNQQGSSVTRGNLLVIPIRGDVLYVQPIYLQATSGKLPELKRVIVSYANRIAMGMTLEEALLSVFRVQAQQAANGDTDARQAVETEADPRALARSALERYNRAVTAQRQGDWARYGEELNLLKKDLDRLAAQAAQKR